MLKTNWLVYIFTPHRLEHNLHFVTFCFAVGWKFGLETKDRKKSNKAKPYFLCAHILIGVTETVNKASLNYYAEDQTKGLIYISSIYSSLTYTSSPYIFEVYILIFAIYKNSWTIYNFKHKYGIVNLKGFGLKTIQQY